MPAPKSPKKKPAAEAPKTTVFLRGDFITKAQAVAAESHKGNFSAYVQSLVEKDIAERAAGAPLLELAAKYAPWAKETAAVLFEGVNQSRFIAMLMEEVTIGYAHSLANSFATEEEAQVLQKAGEEAMSLQIKVANRALRTKADDTEPCILHYGESLRLQSDADDLSGLLTDIFAKGRKPADLVDVEIHTHPKYGKFVASHSMRRPPITPAPAAMIAKAQALERQFREERENRLSGK